jgi:zinc and cadmium transporter
MMQMSFIYALLAVTVVSLISLVGVITIPFGKHTKSILLYFISFSVGALLGDVFLHLLPEVVDKMGFGVDVSMWILGGIIVTFLLEKGIHWHHSHQEDCHESHANPLAFMTLVGDGAHNIIDGIVIAASFAISTHVGVATTIAVVLHEIPQELGNFGILIHSGYTRSRALLFNLISALTAFAGLAIFYLIQNRSEHISLVLSAAAAGNFIYLAAADMIPELHKRPGVKNSFFQLVTMLFGMGIMLLLLRLG